MKPRKPTLLDSIETSDQIVPPKTYAEYKRSFTPDLWQRVAQVYSYIDNRDGTNRYQRLLECRTRAWFARHRESGKVVVFANACKLRWCPLCQAVDRFYAKTSTLLWLRKQASPKFLTLTLRHSMAPLSHQVDSLYYYFKQLRKTKLWKDNVAGGIWFFQMTQNDVDGRWHPHLHIVMQSKYIPQADLSRLWLRITKGSPVVDIRCVHNPQQAADYVSRYCTSPIKLTDLDFHACVDLVDELHGRRLVGTFGTAHGLRLKAGKRDDADAWENIGSWWTVTQLVNTNRDAFDIWDAWQRGTSLPEGVSVAGIDQFLDGFDDVVDNAPDPPWHHPLLFRD